MPEPELSLLFVRPLNRLEVRYMVSGSVAAILYGELRLTHDVDFVVLLRSEDIDRLLRSMVTVSGEEIDRGTLEKWIRRQGVEAQWRQAVQSA
jgi:hypothetical protein